MRDGYLKYSRILYRLRSVLVDIESGKNRIVTEKLVLLSWMSEHEWPCRFRTY